MKEAVGLYVDTLREKGLAVPPPAVLSNSVAV